MGSNCLRKKASVTSFTDYNSNPCSPPNLKKGPLIGQGAYGKVYQYINIDTGDFLAVKQIELAGSPDQITNQLESLKQEISILQTLSHPNIIAYVSVSINHELPGVNIAMEYMSGGSLQQLMEKFGKFEEETTSAYIQQVLKGLRYLHKNGIIHRDIKAANILLSKYGRIKLSDFGSYKRLGSEYSKCKDEICKSLRGSPYWMAPEVANRKGHNFAADIWSVGCLTIELLSCSAPWSTVSRSSREVLDLIIECKRPPIPEGFSKECRDFIELCLRINPSERPSANYLLKHGFIKMHKKERTVNRKSI